MATNTALLDQIIEQIIAANSGASTDDIADAALAAEQRHQGPESFL